MHEDSSAGAPGGALYRIVLRLYDANHSVPLGRVQPLPFPEGPLPHLWEMFWRDLGFDTESPAGSSRLMQLAMVQSLGCGGPEVALGALWRVLGEAPCTTATSFFIRELRGAVRADPRLESAGRFGDELPIDGISDGQVLLLGWMSETRFDEVAGRFHVLIDKLDG